MAAALREARPQLPITPFEVKTSIGAPTGEANPRRGRVPVPEITRSLPTKAIETQPAKAMKGEGDLPFTLNFVEPPAEIKRSRSAQGPKNPNEDTNQDGSIGETVTMSVTTIESRGPVSANDGMDKD